MKNLKDFLNASSENSSGLSNSESKERSVSMIANALVTGKLSSNIALTMKNSGILTSQSKAEKFGEDVTRLVASDEVLSELSDEVGFPLANETESEFVARAKRSLKKILMSKFAGK